MDDFLTLLKLGDLTLAPSESLKTRLIANWMARPVMVPVESGSIFWTACRSPALVWWVLRENSFLTALA